MIDVRIRPGTVINAQVMKKTSGDEIPVIVKDIHINVDGCVGSSSLRSYAILTSSSTHTEDVVAYYGVPEDLLTPAQPNSSGSGNDRVDRQCAEHRRQVVVECKNSRSGLTACRAARRRAAQGAESGTRRRRTRDSGVEPARRRGNQRAPSRPR